jgi:thioredoxin
MGFKTFNIFLQGQPSSVTHGNLTGITYEWRLEGGILKPVPMVKIVFVSEDGTATESVKSDGSGQYRIRLRVGRYRITATHPDYPVYDPDGFLVIRPVEDTQVANIPMGQPHLHGNVGGSVWERRSDGSFGPKIPGVKITFIPEGGGNPVSVTTLYYGGYRADLSPGRYQVTATHPDYENYDGSVVVTEEQAFRVFNIFMMRAVHPIIVSDADFDSVVLESPIPVLVDFYADWCSACVALEPILKEFASAHGGQVLVAKLNTDENPNTVNRYDVQYLPTLILFRDGQEAGRRIGFVAYDPLCEWVDSLLS